MDTRRTILWIIFSFSLILLWDAWLKHTGKPPMFFGAPATQTAPAPAPVTPPQAAAAGDVPQASALPAAAAPAGATPAAVPGAAAPAGQRVKIATDLVAAEIDTAGAELARLELLLHRDQQDKTRNVVLLDNTPGSRIYLAQTGLIGGDFPTHKTVFTRVPGPDTLAEGQSTLEVAFEATQGGVTLRKTYVFKRGSYLIDVRHDVTNAGAAPMTPALYQQITRDGNAPAGESRFMVTYTGPAFYADSTKYRKVAFSDIEKNKAEFAKTASDGWVAIIQHYFVTAWVPKAGVERENYARKVGDNLYAVGAIQPLGALAAGATTTAASQLYVGPQDQKVLETIAPGLDLVVDYGWLTMIAKPLFWLLQLFHSWTGNWGWAIILLTVAVKGAFYPLSAASYKSMAKMRAVGPRLKKIQEQYKEDRQKMNMALMELYKTEKINPLGGCLPILIQMPVFIALYWTLLAAVEMRGAPWLGWISDLTAMDPFFILPVIMIATMWVQYKLNPTPPDPVQAKVFAVMPFIFGGMMAFFPSGLVLYWVVNNLLSIAQQWQITRMIEGKPLFGRAK